MARAANKENMERDEGNIDFAGALEIIQTTIHGIESNQRGLSKDAGDAWKQIEDLGINKKGAQLFSSILKKPVEHRRDEFRSLVKLAQQAGWFSWFDDLVDRAEGAPVLKQAPGAPAPIEPEAAAPLPPPPPPPAPPPPPPAGDVDLVEAGDATAAAKKPTAAPAAGKPFERIDLKRHWLQRVRNDARDKPVLDESDWEDVRQATGPELAAERNRLADFSDDPPPASAAIIEEAKTEVAEKATGKRSPRGGRPTLTAVK